MPAITALPPVPTRADPTNFAAKADDFLTHLEDTFVPELNALSDDVTTKSDSVAASEIVVTDAKNTAQATANFKGAWESLTGPLNVPASVKYNDDQVYLLLEDLTDVTAYVPGSSTKWLNITNVLQGISTPYAARLQLDLYSTTQVNTLINQNLIRNPSFYLDTRETGTSVTLAAGAVGRDRWKAGTGGCTYSVNSVGAGLTSSEQYLNITAGSIGQYINPRMMERTSTPVQYILTWEGTAEGRINSGTWGATGRTVDSGGTVLGGMVVDTLGGTALTGFFVEFRNGTVIRPQFKRADIAAGWVAADYLEDFNDAKNYAWVNKGTAAFAYRSYATASTSAFVQVFFPEVMAFTPTVTKVGTWSVTNCSQPTITDVSNTSFLLRTTVTATGVFSFNTVDSTTGITAFTPW